MTQIIRIDKLGTAIRVRGMSRGLCKALQNFLDTYKPTPAHQRGKPLRQEELFQKIRDLVGDSSRTLEFQPASWLEDPVSFDGVYVVAEEE